MSKENFELFHFSEQIKNNEPTFDHKIKEGKLTTRNAIKILELYNYPAEIIEDVRKTEKNNVCQQRTELKNKSFYFFFLSGFCQVLNTE